MRDKELWLNGSGYADPTAYNALKEIMKMEIKAGEIYNTKTDRDMGRQVLILATDGRVCTVLNVKEEGQELDDLHFVVDGKEIHMNSRMLQYCFANKLEYKVHTLTESQFDCVMYGVAKSLGIEFDDSEELECAREMVAEKTQRIDYLERRNAEYIDTIREKNAEIKQLSDELQDVILADNPSADMVRLETERDLYKNLYEQAFERLVEVRR